MLKELGEFIGGLFGGYMERRAAAKPWRWGHRYPNAGLPSDYVCENCDRHDPFQSRVTNPPCPGPSRERAAQLKARGRT